MSTPGIFGPERAFTADLKVNGGAVTIGGLDVSEHVRGIRIAATANGAPQIEVELSVFQATRVESEQADVLMHEGTRELLLAAGWTPPATTDATRRPWFAVATDESGLVLDPNEIVMADQVAFLVVGRGSVEPIGNRRMPEAAAADDVLYELDLVGDTAERIRTCWAQALHVVAALNATQAVTP